MEWFKNFSIKEWFDIENWSLEILISLLFITTFLLYMPKKFNEHIYNVVLKYNGFISILWIFSITLIGVHILKKIIKLLRKKIIKRNYKNEVKKLPKNEFAVIKRILTSQDFSSTENLSSGHIHNLRARNFIKIIDNEILYLGNQGEKALLVTVNFFIADLYQNDLEFKNLFMD